MPSRKSARKQKEVSIERNKTREGEFFDRELLLKMFNIDILIEAAVEAGFNDPKTTALAAFETDGACCNLTFTYCSKGSPKALCL